MKVYQAISNVMRDIAAEGGIAKDRNNAQQGYRFRGIDDVYNALSPILAQHGVMLLPRVVARDVAERQTKNGGALFYTTLEVEFDVVCAEDGSKHTIRVIGEAMDSADKSSNKAMSAAYKYAAMQVFCIPTEGDNDPDSHTHQVKPKEQPKQQPKQQAPQPRTPEDIAKADAKAYLDKLGLTPSDMDAFVKACKDRGLKSSEVALQARDDLVDTAEALQLFVAGLKGDEQK